MQSDGLTQAQVEMSESGLPILQGQSGEDFRRILFFRFAKLFNRDIDFLENFLVPLSVGGQVRERPCGSDTGVDDSSQETTDDKLPIVTIHSPFPICFAGERGLTEEMATTGSSRSISTCIASSPRLG